jgi:hypothetical protein
LSVIFQDDPLAIEKLNAKLARLLIEKNEIKSREHKGWELSNLGATIRSVKQKIEIITKRKENNQTLERKTTFKEGHKCFFYETIQN